MGDKINAYYRLKDENCSKDDFNYHSHEKFEIYFFHGGNCKYLIGDHIYHLEEDDVIIMNGLTLHRANPEPDLAYERSVIEFSAEWLRPILASLNVPELLNPFDQLSFALFRGVDATAILEIKALIRRIALLDLKAVNAPNHTFDSRIKEGEASTLLVQLLFKIFELSKLRLVKMPTTKSEKSVHVNRVIAWIDANFDSDIKLDSITEDLNISKYYMSRIFKDVTGYTIMQYLMQCRINRAKYLLEIYPDKSILEVAIESGFANCSHFSRFFRKQVELTPSEYRNMKTYSFQSKDPDLLSK